MWMRTSEVEVACVSERASESWFNHMTSSKGLHSLTTLNAHKQ